MSADWEAQQRRERDDYWSGVADDRQAQRREQYDGREEDRRHWHTPYA